MHAGWRILAIRPTEHLGLEEHVFGHVRWLRSPKQVLRILFVFDGAPQHPRKTLGL